MRFKNRAVIGMVRSRFGGLRCTKMPSVGLKCCKEMRQCSRDLRQSTIVPVIVLLLFNTTRMVPGPPSTGVAIAMDGGMADTACYYTGR